MSTSKIEWTDKVWNPVRGCSKVSAGCANCYAERQGARFSKPGCGPTADSDGREGGPFDGFVRNGKWTGRVELVPDALDKPLRWRKPKRVFVNSMSDLFHEALPDEAIDRVFAVTQLAPQHTFQVLTKRPDRMREYFKGDWRWRVLEAKKPMDPEHRTGMGGLLRTTNGALPNVWLGVSVEDQASADARIPTLLETPAAVRWVSYEPALGPVDFTKVRWYPGCRSEDYYDATAGLDWLVVGGESGPGARPCDMAWIRSALEQCKAAGVPCFVKQIGARPVTQHPMEVGALVEARCTHPKGGDPDEWPEDLRVREFPPKS